MRAINSVRRRFLARCKTRTMRDDAGKTSPGREYTLTYLTYGRPRTNYYCAFVCYRYEKRRKSFTVFRSLSDLFDTLAFLSRQTAATRYLPYVHVLYVRRIPGNFHGVGFRIKKKYGQKLSKESCIRYHGRSAKTDLINFVLCYFIFLLLYSITNDRFFIYYTPPKKLVRRIHADCSTTLCIE